MKSNSINRIKELQHLSHEHHHGLSFCRNIRKGFKVCVEIERIKRYSDWFYINNLIPHFYVEEKFIFPILGSKNEHIIRALTEHRKLKKYFEDSFYPYKSLNKIKQLLENHIRFEERLLFNEIQAVANDNQLREIEGIHKTENNQWNDKFWK